MTYNKEWLSYIPDGYINKSIAKYHSERPERHQTHATPSSLTMCPRTVWLRYKSLIKPTNEIGWGKQQRNMAGRMFENLAAEQLKASGNLLYHWKDDEENESVKFSAGKGLTKLEGTPDLLLKLDKVVISDAKTSRGDSFAYVPIKIDEVWKDVFWDRYRIQLNAYYLLCHKNKEWFKAERVEVPSYIKDTRTGEVQLVEKNKVTIRGSLPLPEACHLFSYALDDGIVRREFTWTPTKKDFEEVLRLTKKWNIAYASETMPDCECTPDTTKFCPYAYEYETTKSGYKLGVKCCSDKLVQELSKPKEKVNV